MTKTLTLTALAAALLLPANAAAAPHRLLFVLAGQSNMVGHAQPIPAEKPTSHVMRVTLNNQLVPAEDPLGEQGDPAVAGSGFGPGMPFAWALEHRLRHTQIVLLMCAAGGTSIAEWQPGQPLFDTCAARTRAALAAGDGPLAGVLWLQGETDAMDPATAPGWAAGFTNVVGGFRQLGRVPFVFGQIGTLTDPRFVAQQEIRDEQAAIALPGVSMVSTVGLPVADGIHFTQAAYMTVGERFERAWWKAAHPLSTV